MLCKDGSAYKFVTCTQREGNSQIQEKLKSNGKIRSIGVRYNHVDIHRDNF